MLVLYPTAVSLIGSLQHYSLTDQDRSFVFLRNYLDVLSDSAFQRAAVTTAKDQAISAGLEAGAQLVASRILTDPALPGLLSGSKPSTPSVDLPMQDSPTPPFVFPRPRPAAMG